MIERHNFRAPLTTRSGSDIKFLPLRIFQYVPETKLRRNNTSGLIGVSHHKGRWRARIHFQGVDRCLGFFDSPEEASAAYEAAANWKRLNCESFDWTPDFSRPKT